MLISIQTKIIVNSFMFTIISNLKYYNIIKSNRELFRHIIECIFTQYKFECILWILN